MWLERNLEVLKRQDERLARRILQTRIPPEYEIIRSKTGLPVLRVGNTTLHSVYDPVREAEQWARHQEVQRVPTLAVLGMGMGYHVQAVLDRAEGEVWVFEPDLSVLRAALESLDLTSVLPRVKIQTGRQETLFRAVCHSNSAILLHGPSRALAPCVYDAAKGRMRLNGLQPLRILTVGPIYGGSLPITRYCALALRRMGHEVEELEYEGAVSLYHGIERTTGQPEHQDTLRRHLMNLLSEMAVARCAEFKPDLVLALAQAPLHSDALLRMRDAGATLAYWFVEDFRYMDYWKGIVPAYDYFFVIQRGEFLRSIQALGGALCHYLPTGAEPEIHKPLKLSEDDLREYGSDLSFVGAGYHNRQKFFQGLMDMDFKIWGSDWNLTAPLGRCIQRGGARISTEESVKIFNASRINLNLHSSTYHRGVNPEGDFLNPRTFEVAACGRFQLVDERSELSDLFDTGAEICTFKNLEDFREKARYYLSHPTEADSMAGAARERVLLEHTYQSRMEEMLGLMMERGLRASRGTSLMKESVENLIAEAGAGTELGDYLTRFKDKKSITLGDIVEEIQKGEGRLSEPEAIFLLMSELAANR